MSISNKPSDMKLPPDIGPWRPPVDVKKPQPDLAVADIAKAKPVAARQVGNGVEITLSNKVKVEWSGSLNDAVTVRVNNEPYHSLNLDSGVRVALGNALKGGREPDLKRFVMQGGFQGAAANIYLHVERFLLDGKHDDLADYPSKQDKAPMMQSPSKIS